MKKHSLQNVLFLYFYLKNLMVKKMYYIYNVKLDVKYVDYYL